MIRFKYSLIKVKLYYLCFKKLKIIFQQKLFKKKKKDNAHNLSIYNTYPYKVNYLFILIKFISHHR